MHKVYLAIIAILLLVLSFVWLQPNEFSQDQTDLDEKSDGVSNIQKGGESTNSIDTFEEYFSGVTPKEGLLENKEGAVINLENVPKEETKQYAAGLLLEARKAVNSEGAIESPKLDNLDSFFSPTDTQLKALLGIAESTLATRILNSSVQINQANELIDNEELTRELDALKEKFIEIELYEQKTLYEFSLALHKYKKAIENVILITNTFTVDNTG